MNNRQAAVIAAASLIGRVNTPGWERLLEERAETVLAWLDRQDAEEGKLEPGSLRDTRKDVRRDRRERGGQPVYDGTPH